MTGGGERGGGGERDGELELTDDSGSAVRFERFVDVLTEACKF